MKEPRNAKRILKPKQQPAWILATPRKSTLNLELLGPKEALPQFVAPQLASLSTTPPTDSGWLHELKLDGYRIQAVVHDGQARLLTRTGLDWTHRMRSVANDATALPVKSAVFDGEVVVLGQDGTTSFAELQASFQDSSAKPLTYFIFDLLHLNGHNLRNLPLLKRKTILSNLLAKNTGSLRLSEHLATSGEVMFHKACELRAEGIISKRADGHYRPGRSLDWLKLKCIHEQEFVIGGFTLPSKGHADMHAIGSLLLGYYDASGRLIYAGRTGTGFTHKTHAQIRTKLDTIQQKQESFHKPPKEARRGAIWVQPKLVAQVRFATWTADNLVRQASFQGLREDKSPDQVRREAPVLKPRTKRSVIDRASHATPANIATKSRKVPPPAGAKTNHAPVRLTHADKSLDKESHLTKQQLADYYWEISSHMLPHIEGRPLSLVRCPEGSTEPCFFQRHTNHMLPPGIEAIAVPNKKTGKPESYITLSTREALAGLAQMGVLEVHPWGSRNKHLEEPDRIIIDLDPDSAIPWRILANAAKEIRERFNKLGLKSFLKSTGGKGLHVVVPIEAQHTWSTVKQFAHAIVVDLETRAPDLYLTRMSKAERKHKIFLDYLRNDRGATAVAPFSPRARAGAPVSMPLGWLDLNLSDRPVFRVSEYQTWRNRVARDPWKPLASTGQRLSKEILAAYNIRPTDRHG